MSYILRCSVLLLSSFVGLQLQAQENNKDINVNDYIAEYKDIAIQEMERSGIPASITLAQGIHESAYGNSELARKAKNHFGIKCTKDWQGKTMYKWDDEAHKSCFRFYTSAEESYVDHTDFLLNRKHYAFLFNYDRTDYKRWAKGLRKAGYATDPRYPEKLIKTIELYQLQQYDKATGVLTYDTSRLTIPKDIAIGKRQKPSSFFFKRYKPGFFRTNGATYAISRKGESALAVAKRFGIPYKRFLKFNDLEDGDELMAYQPAYIQPKKNTYKGEEEVYKVEKDITMYEIAQEFGIKLSSLLELNLMKKGEEPQNGETIQLKLLATTKPKLRPRNHVDILPSPYVEDDKNAPLKTPVETSTPVVITRVERPKPQSLQINTPTYEPSIYTPTTSINTSTSNDKAFLDATILPSTPTSTTDSPMANSTTSTNGTTVAKQPPVDANTLFKPVDNTPKNTTIIQPKNPSNSSIEPFPNNTNSNVFQGQQTANTIQFNNSGSTRDYHKSVKPVIENPNTLPNNTTVIQPSNNKGIYHTVKKGETLYAIHRLYEVPVTAIQEANKLVGTTIEIGQRLKIPVK